MHSHHSVKAKLIVFIGLLILFWAWTSFSAQDIFERTIPALQKYAEENRGPVTLVFIGLAALSALLGPFTSAFLVPAAVAVWGTEWTFALILFGWIAGGMAAYAIGRYFGFPLVARLVSHEKINLWIEHIRRAETFMFALMFRVALPAETGYLFGLVKYPFFKYVLITFFAELPFALVLVYAGEAFVAQDFWIFAGWIVTGFAVIILAGFIFKKGFRAS